MGDGDAAMSEPNPNNRFSATVVITAGDLRQCASRCYEAYRAFAQEGCAAQLKPWAEVDEQDRFGWIIAAQLAFQRNGGKIVYGVPSQDVKPVG